MIVRLFIGKIDEYEIEFIENIIEFSDLDKKRNISRIINKLPLDQKKSFLITLQNPKNHKKADILVESYMGLENVANKNYLGEFKNIETTQELFPQVKKIIHNLTVQEQFSIVLENLVIIKDLDKKKDILKFLIGNENRLKKRILERNIGNLEEQKRRGLKQLENARTKKRKENKDRRKRDKIDLEFQRRKNAVELRTSREKKLIIKQIVNIKDSKRKEGLIENLSNIRDPITFKKKIIFQTENIRKGKDISDLFEAIFSIYNPEYFWKGIIRNLIISDITKKGQQLVKEFISLDQENTIRADTKALIEKFERFDYIKKLLNGYKESNYLDALGRIRSVYSNDRTIDTIEEIKPLIQRLVIEKGEQVLKEVREKRSLFNRYSKEYVDYSRKKISHYLDLFDIFESIVTRLVKIYYPRRKATHRMLEIEKKINPKWHIKWEEMLLRYKESKPYPNMPLSSELKTIKEVIHIFLSEGRAFLAVGFSKGAFKMCDKARGVIEKCSGIYNLDATREVIDQLEREAIFSSKEGKTSKLLSDN